MEYESNTSCLHLPVFREVRGGCFLVIKKTGGVAIKARFLN
jgi:hypothetical protein